MKNTMNITHRILFFVLAAVVLFATGRAFAETHTLDQLKRANASLPKFTSRERLIGCQILTMATQNHYTHPQISKELSSRWFMNYFDLLDVDHIYFTQKDIENLRVYEQILCEINKRQINLNFAKDAYDLLLERIRERAIFLDEYTRQPQDFTIEEYLDIDPNDKSWAEDMPELREKWRLHAKNAILIDMIEKEREKEEREKNPEKATEDEAGAAPIQERKSIGERLVQRQITQFYTRLDFEPLELLEPYFNALMTLLDPHSSYMAPDTNEDFDIQMSLSLQGIGATLSTRDSYTTIIGIVPGSPAEKCGELHEGDRIVAVTQEGEEPVNVVDMPLNRVVHQIRGPKGTKVRLTILPKNSNREIEVTIVRDEIKMDDNGAQGRLDEITTPGGQTANILTIYIPSFYRDFKGMMEGNPNYRSTTRDVKQVIDDALAEGPVHGVILDFRGNGGGSLDEAVQLPGLFFSDKVPVVQTRGAMNDIRKMATTPKGLLATQPIIVLTDSSSASAAEIVAACLQDTRRAVIIGDRSTHGKGTVQNINDLSELTRLSFNKEFSDGAPSGALRITIAKFYRIQGGSTQLLGVIPDISFPSFYDCLDTTEQYLPNALPWDEIHPLKYPFFKSNWYAHMDELRDIARNFAAASPEFQKYLKFINEFNEFKSKTQLPLALDVRREHIRKDDELIKLLTESMPDFLWRKNSQSDSDSDNDEDKKPHPDVIHAASLEVMGAMINYR